MFKRLNLTDLRATKTGKTPRNKLLFKHTVIVGARPAGRDQDKLLYIRTGLECFWVRMWSCRLSGRWFC